MPDPTENGQSEGDFLSIADRAALAAEHQEDQEALFPDGFMDGDPWTLAKVHKSNKPIEIVASLMSASVPLRGGLPDPAQTKRVIVRTGHIKYEVVPVYEKGGEQEDIESYKIVAKMRCAYVEPMGDPAEVVRTEFNRILEAGPQDAALLAEELSSMAAAWPNPVGQ